MVAVEPHQGTGARLNADGSMALFTTKWSFDPRLGHITLSDPLAVMAATDLAGGSGGYAAHDPAALQSNGLYTCDAGYKMYRLFSMDLKSPSKPVRSEACALHCGARPCTCWFTAVPACSWPVTVCTLLPVHALRGRTATRSEQCACRLPRSSLHTRHQSHNVGAIKSPVTSNTYMYTEHTHVHIMRPVGPNHIECVPVHHPREAAKRRAQLSSAARAAKHLGRHAHRLGWISQARAGVGEGPYAAAGGGCGAVRGAPALWHAAGE